MIKKHDIYSLSLFRIATSNKKYWIDRREEREKKTSKTHQNSDYNITNIIGKTSTRRIERHKEKSPIVIKSSGAHLPPKTNESCATFGPLDLSRQDFFYDTSVVVIEVSVCFWDLLFFFFSFISHLSCLIFFYWMLLYIRNSNKI
jgi:hypothetical protein